MLRLAAIGVVLATAMSACPSASASPAVPAPTLSITTTLGGQPLPVSSMSGSWTVKRSGRQATLSLSGTAVTPTVTTVRSMWTSTMMTVHSIELGVGSDWTTVVPSSDVPSVTLSIEYRSPGGRWHGAGTGVATHTESILDQGGMGSSEKVWLFSPSRMQCRVILVAHYSDTSQQDLNETVGIS